MHSKIKQECLNPCVVFGATHFEYPLREDLAHYLTEGSHQGHDNELLVQTKKRRNATCYEGGEIARERLADFSIVVDWDIPQVQEAQASLYHILKLCLSRVGALMDSPRVLDQTVAHRVLI